MSARCGRLALSLSGYFLAEPIDHIQILFRRQVFRIPSEEVGTPIDEQEYAAIVDSDRLSGGELVLDRMAAQLRDRVLRDLAT